MMEKFTFIDYNQFSSFMQNKDFQANNIVFWTGAGIDCDTPTCLPLGAALTERILSWTCGDMGAELFKKWGEICKAVNSLCWPKEKLHLSSIPRLESILERVRLCEKQSSIDGSNNSVMTMISGFSDAPPNPSHYALAKAISEGASVVTTNYSLCVETAFERLTGKKLSPEKVDNTSVYIYSIPNEAVGRIIHIHGVAFDKESIGISLSSVKNELPSQVVEIIKGWLHESKTFIFAGYSASDVFDVNLLFRHMYDERIHGSDSFFIQHSKNNTPRFHTTEELEKVKAVLLPFSYQYVLDANTAKVLELLFPVNLTEIHKLKDFDWVRLGEMVNYSQGRKLDLFVDLCQFFGIDTSKVLEQPLLYSSKEHQTKGWYSTYPKLAMAILQGRILEAIQFAVLLMRKESSFSGIDHLLRHLLAGAGIFLPFSQKRLYKRVQQIYSAYGSGNAIGWDVSADINQYTDWVMQTIYLRRTESNIKSFMEDTRRLGMCMQRVCKKIIEQGYAGVIEVNQLHLAYRNAAVLLAIYGDLSEFEKSYELLDRSTYYYLEASSIAGLIGNLNAGLFMAIIEKMRNAGIADELILFYYDAASRLCDIAGTKRYARFKDKLWTFYKRVSCAW